MKKIIPVVVIAVVAVIGGYFYGQYNQPKPAAPVPVAPPPKPVTRQVLEPPQTPLPALAESDGFMLDGLAGLVGDKSLMAYFIPKRLIRNIVVTIDNLPAGKLSMRMMPVKEASGRFITGGGENHLTISPANAARYTPYVKIAEAIDTKKLVEFYVRAYPLFQQAYEELGYPNKYFNDRLLAVIDHLLAAPDIQEPVQLIRPKVFYEYANPDFEARSIGQRILMRIGSKNEATIKAKLRDIRQELVLHLRAQKVESAK